MDVYVVMSGEYAEGGSIHAVFSTLDAAIAFAKSVPCSFGEWEEGDNFNVLRPCWQRGCDWLSVECHEVKGTED